MLGERGIVRVGIDTAEPAGLPEAGLFGIGRGKRPQAVCLAIGLGEAPAKMRAVDLPALSERRPDRTFDAGDVARIFSVPGER